MVSFVNNFPSQFPNRLFSQRERQSYLCGTTPRCKADISGPKPPYLKEQREEIMHVLKRDLLRQYDEPRQLNWDIYDDDITFDDPATQLSGKLQYRVRRRV